MPLTLPFSRQEYHTRIRRTEAAMERAGLDALIAYSVRNQPGPAAYLAGYEPRLGLHDVAFFVISPGGRSRYTLLTNAFWDPLAQFTWVEDIVVTADFGPRLAALAPASARRVGIAGLPFFPTPVYLSLARARPDLRFENATPLLWEVARVKSSAEIAALRRASGITDAGGRAFLSAARVGASEREIRADVERAILLAGAEGLSYSVQIYSGPQVAVGIGFDADRVLASGEQVQVDCGAVCHGYRGDLSRVTTAGAPLPAARAIMEATADMYEAMLAAVRPGLAVRELAQVAIACAREHGLEDDMYRSPNHPVRSVGHGIGCWYSEPPDISPASDDALEENMVLVLEPILGRPGVGGAKIEDPVVVTAAGAERLSGLEIRTWER
jgi:Xaa-Pro aminopeptidase